MAEMNWTAEAQTWLRKVFEYIAEDRMSRTIREHEREGCKA